MAVSEQTPYIEYVANGVSSTFSLGFECSNPEFLIVKKDGVVVDTSTWSLIDNGVVFNEPPSISTKLVFERDSAIERSTNFQTADNSFRPAPLNNNLDYLVYILQEISARLIREINDRKLSNSELTQYIKDYVETILSINNPEAITLVVADIVQTVIDGDVKSQQDFNEYLLNYINIKYPSITEFLDVSETAFNNFVSTNQTTINNTVDQAQTDVSQAISSIQPTVDAAIANAGNMIGAANKAALDLITDKLNNQVAMLDNGDIYRFSKPNSSPGTWVFTGFNYIAQAATDATTKANAAEVGAKKYADIEKASKKAVDQIGSTSVALQFSSLDDKNLGQIKSDGSFHLSGEDESLQDQLQNRPKKIGDKTVAYSFDDLNNQSLLSITEDGCLYLAGEDRSVQDKIFASKSDGRIAIINNAKLIQLSKNNEDVAWLKNHNRISSSRDTTPNASNRIPAVVKIPTGVLIMYSERISPYDGDNEGARLMQRFVTLDADYKVTSISTAQEVTRPSVDTGLTKHPMLCRAANNNLVLIYDERETTTTNYRQYVRTSSDNGVTWSSAVEIPQNSAAGGQVCAVGSTGTMAVMGSGRIVCPMYTTNSIWMMYSDNNGASWTHGAIASGTVSAITYSIAEPSITIDKDGNILISVRSQKSGFYKKLLYKSTDNGATTQFYRIADELVSASCASSIFYDSENDLMLHSTPSNAGASRTKYRLQYSTDNGANFIAAYRPFPETHYVGYSQIIKLVSNTYLVVFEGDEYFQSVNSYENIATIIINTSEILNHVNYS